MHVVSPHVISTEVLNQEGAGVIILRSAFNNTVGGTASGANNIIAFNDGTGVAVFGTSAINNQILGNSIYSNGTLGIDLQLDGMTPNDLSDPDVGANNLQNYPVLTSATRGGSTANVQDTFNSTPNLSFRIELT